MRYKGLKTVLGNKADGSALATTALSSEPSYRDVSTREFYWASAFNREAATSTTVTLRYKSSSSISDSAAIRIDEVALLPGESAIWTYEDYGFDMDRSGYIEILASGSQSVDFAIRTRDRTR